MQSKLKLRLPNFTEENPFGKLAKFKMQNSNWLNCLQFSFAYMSHVWLLQLWHRKKKKMIQTCSLLRKSSLKRVRRLQVTFSIHWQNEAVSGAYFVPGAALPSRNAFCSWSSGAHNEMDKFLDIVALRMDIVQKYWNFLPPFGLVRLLRGWHLSTWNQARHKWNLW